MIMKNFDSIQNLWHTDIESNLPGSKEIIAQIQKTRKKMLRRNIIGAALLILTFIYIIFIGWYYHFERWTTRIGIIITLLAIIMGVVFNTKLVQLLLKQEDLTLDNKKYLEQLIHYRNVQHAIHFKGIACYFILLAVGISFYMAEFAERNIYFGIAAYTITLAWIAFAWFYFHKRATKKLGKEIDLQIENLKNLTGKNEEDS